MTWNAIYLKDAEDDYHSLDHRQQVIVDKAIERVQENPLPQNEGGYGKPLGHKGGRNLTGFLKIKLKGDGIRIVYKLIRTQTTILVVVIGMREDDEIYEIAVRRKKKYGL